MSERMSECFVHSLSTSRTGYCSLEKLNDQMKHPTDNGIRTLSHTHTHTKFSCPVCDMLVLYLTFIIKAFNLGGGQCVVDGGGCHGDQLC